MGTRKVNLNDVFKNTFLIKIGFSTDSGEYKNKLTAFSFEYKGKQYLVTTLRALQYEKKTGKDKPIKKFHELNDEVIDIKIYRNRHWDPIRVRFVVKGFQNPADDKFEPGRDVLVFEPLDSTWLTFPSLTGIVPNDMKIGAEIRFLGFPHLLNDIGYDNINRLDNGYPTPLLRGGYLAGCTEECKVIFLDAHNCNGFSGGPVVFKDPIDGGFQVFGVITDFFPEKIEENISNSGITICASISYVTELLDNYLAAKGSRK